MAQVILQQVRKAFDDAVIVRDIDLHVHDREFVVLVGPSGCGKTTALRLIAGLETLSAGVIRIGDRVVNDVAPKDRDIAMVFQNYALYPHMSVYDNMAFGLKMRKIPRDERDRRVREAAAILDLDPLLSRKPKALSGGQRQRVALGRAIVRDPKVFLMDEPLSNLDAKLRATMRSEIIRLHRRLQATTLYVTHDQVEAMTMGDRIVILNQGVIQQQGAPMAVYQQPANRFVAGFIGQMSFFEVLLDNGQVRWPCGTTLGLPPSLASLPSGPVILGIRPEHCHQQPLAGSEPCQPLTVVPDLIERLGAHQQVHFHLPHTPAATGLAHVDADATLALEQPVSLWLETRRLLLFDPHTGQRLGSG